MIDQAIVHQLLKMVTKNIMDIIEKKIKTVHDHRQAERRAKQIQESSIQFQRNYQDPIRPSRTSYSRPLRKFNNLG